MTASRPRGVSPMAPRVYLETPRASTGGLTTSQTYDTRYDTRPRSSFSSSTTSREGTSARNNSVYDTQPVSKQTYPDRGHGGGTVSRTEYVVRPRRDSTSAESRRPLSVTTKNPSPTRQRPPILSPGAMVVYETPRDIKDNARYLQPSHGQGTSHHQRHNSAGRADLDRYSISQTPNRAEREYHRRGPYVEKVADSHSHPPPPPIRYSDDGGPGSFSYTTPRQQFERDLGSGTGFRPNRRESTNRREWPPSVEADRYEQNPPRHSTNPQVSSPRALERIERDDRRSGFESDPDRSRDSRKIKTSERGPVVHQQRDDGYSSAREEYELRRPSRSQRKDEIMTTSGKNRYQSLDYDKNRAVPREYERERKDGRYEREKGSERYDERRNEPQREREYDRDRERPHRPREYERIEHEDDSRRKPRSRETSPDHSGAKKLAAGAAAGGLVAAGLTSRKDRREDGASDSETRREKKSRRQRSRDRRDEDDHPGDSRDDERRRTERPVHSSRRNDSSGSDTPEDDKNRRRPQSRTRRRRDTYDGYGSDRDKPQLALPAPEPHRRSSRAAEDSLPPERLQDKDIEIMPERVATRSPVKEDDPLREPALVEQPKEKKEEVKPKGILKKPRTNPFPEDPNPQREGVAPLKQAGKDGISPGARWTKISRILVNPEALEKAQERFEEREDYVIVLRVLSKEEIEKLAERTREIRSQRERDWQRQAEEHQRRYGKDRGYPDDEDDRDRPQQLAIEAPPPAPPVDLRQLAGQNQSAAPPIMPGGYGPQQWNNPSSARNSGDQVSIPVPAAGPPQGQQHAMNQQPEFDVSNYSQNV